jgi:hypothetical protein
LGGSHFNSSCVFGVNYGRIVGNWSFDNCLTEVVPPDVLDATTAPSSTSDAARAFGSALAAAAAAIVLHHHHQLSF